MKKPERFDNAIAALVKGYLKGTLMKGYCAQCAVGNMVAASCGYHIPTTPSHSWISPITGRGVMSFWDDVFATHNDEEQKFDLSQYYDESKVQIDATGYTPHELASVELAFERATKIVGLGYGEYSPEEVDADQLRGLHAVVQVLCDIEGITDTAPYKAQFDKSLPLADIIVG